MTKDSLHIDDQLQADAQPEPEVLEPELNDDDQAIEEVLSQLRRDITPVSLPQEELAVVTAELVEDSIGPREFDMPVPGIFGAGAVDEGEEPKSSRKLYISLLAVGLLALVAASIAVYLLVYAPVPVPKVVGMPLTEAIAAINSAGFKVGDISETESATVEEGIILNQIPRADENALKGSTVSLSVAKASNSSMVPLVVGKSLESAREELLSSRLDVKVITSFSDSVKKGEVIAQMPADRTVVPRASTVTIMVSEGGTTNAIFAPRIIGLGEKEAEELLESKGLRSVFAHAATSFGNLNEVVGQTPASRSLVLPGGVVFGVINRAAVAQDASIPSLEGKYIDEARDLAERAGFRPEFLFMSSDTVATGNVIAQNPASKDTLLKRGSTLTLLISTGDKKVEALPDLLGLKGYEARAKLEQLGFRVILINESGEEDTEAIVSQQYPAKDYEYQLGFPVLIYNGAE